MASSSHTTSTDPRGIIRGSCSSDDCDCQRYECDGQQAPCVYCGCPPPKHVALSSGSNSSSILTSSPLNIPTSGSGSGSNFLMISPDPDVFGDLLNSENVDPGLTDHDATSSDIPMPARLPDDIEKALKANKLTANQRSVLCRTVVRGLSFLGRDSNDDLMLAAEKIIKKYPPMKRSNDPDNKNLYKKLLRCRNRNTNGTERDKTVAAAVSGQQDTRPLTAEEAQLQMTNKWSSGEKSVTVMGPLLEACRSSRRKEALRTKSLDLIVLYPALTIPALLIREFEVHPDIMMSSQTMIQRWKTSLPHLVTYFATKNIYRIEESLSEDEKTCSILENLHRVPVLDPKKKTFSRSVFVLERFPENTPSGETAPSSKDPPRLIGIAEAGTTNYVCFSETEPVFVVNDIIEALVLLLATYWEFNLNYTPANKKTVLFIAACLLGTSKINKFLGRNDKFLDLCELCKFEA